jgi:hypothetical protein
LFDDIHSNNLLIKYIKNFASNGIHTTSIQYLKSASTTLYYLKETGCFQKNPLI